MNSYLWLKDTANQDAKHGILITISGVLAVAVALFYAYLLIITLVDSSHISISMLLASVALLLMFASCVLTAVYAFIYYGKKKSNLFNYALPFSLVYCIIYFGLSAVTGIFSIIYLVLIPFVLARAYFSVLFLLHGKLTKVQKIVFCIVSLFTGYDTIPILIIVCFCDPDYRYKEPFSIRDFQKIKTIFSGDSSKEKPNVLSNPSSNGVSVSDKLQRAKDEYDSGKISLDEYNSKRQEILSSL